MFWLSRSGKTLHASGLKRRITPGPVSTVERRVRDFFNGLSLNENGSGVDTDKNCGPALLVGALPFERAGADLLFQPKHATWEDADLAGKLCLPRVTSSTRPYHPRIIDDNSAAEFAAAVSAVLSRLSNEPETLLEKVVLARRLQIETEQPVDAHALLARLARDQTIATYLLDLSPASGKKDHLFVGATPELLVSRKELAITSHPLAGSAPRMRDSGADRDAAADLLTSSKDLREHALVVEAIMDSLSPLCAQLHAPDGTGLRATAAMWHLGTRIEGMLKSEDGPSAAGLAALLHPTPAVGGYPQKLAMETIRELEGRDRGFYAGAIGWTDAKGDGEFYVALRCAEICGTHLTLHAGAGIVEGSIPESEVNETAAKFRTMLQALEIDDEGAFVEMTL